MEDFCLVCYTEDNLIPLPLDGHICERCQVLVEDQCSVGRPMPYIERTPWEREGF